MYKEDNCLDTESSSVVAWDWEGEWELIANKPEVMEYSRTGLWEWPHSPINILKIIELYAHNGPIFTVYKFYSNKAVKKN